MTSKNTIPQTSTQSEDEPITLPKGYVYVVLMTNLKGVTEIFSIHNTKKGAKLIMNAIKHCHDPVIEIWSVRDN